MMDRAEHDELVTIRTQLTVALLAVTQLQRKHAESADADRLLTYISTALARITREVHTIDARMARLEERAAMHTNPARPRIHCPTGSNRGPQEHGESVHRHAKSTDSPSTAP